ncbi:MAG: hypothetical protein OEZ10_07255 [Gammaproteobacteria bacterium]|nr:hypothetical protein [Gammaproteobacteria bacterium]
MDGPIHSSSRAVSLYIDELLLSATESVHHVQAFDCHGLCLGVWAEQVAALVYNIDAETEAAWRETRVMKFEGRHLRLLDPAELVFPQDQQPPEIAGRMDTCLVVLAGHELALWSRQPRYFRQPESSLVFRTQRTSRNWLEATCSQPACAVLDTGVVAAFAGRF